MKPRKAIHFGVIIDKRTGSVVRIFNPTFEFELHRHHVADHEKMLRLKKSEHQIGRHHNAMTAADAHRLIKQYSGAA